MRNSPPDFTRTLDLEGGGVCILTGPDTEIEITVFDAEGNGGTVKLGMIAANQFQAALLDRILHIEARRRGFDASVEA